MDMLDRFIGHDAWTTRQLLLACQDLSDDLLDRAFEMDHHSIRATFTHMIENMEGWTDLMRERPVQSNSGTTMAELLVRHGAASREFAHLARDIARAGRYDDCFVDLLEDPLKKRTFGGAIGHVVTHNMHHRAQIMWLMERVGLTQHIEGDLLGWESVAFGWA
jgi:uncharacterized damage-inducible protein DinB